MVDTISSLASTDYRHDEWGVDVTVGGSQKGLMLPPGMSFNAVSDKALAASKTSKLPKSFWAWDDMLTMNKQRLLPLHAGDANAVWPRSTRSTCCTRKGSTTCSPATPGSPRRRAARCAPGASKSCAATPKYYSPTVTAVLLPDGHDADAFRSVALDTFNISYGASFGPYAKKYFRIGHLGDINDADADGRARRRPKWRSALAGVPHKKGGVQAAMDYIVSAHSRRARG